VLQHEVAIPAGLTLFLPIKYNLSQRAPYNSGLSTFSLKARKLAIIFSFLQIQICYRSMNS